MLAVGAPRLAQPMTPTHWHAPSHENRSVPQPTVPSPQARTILVRNQDVRLSEDPVRAEALETSVAAFLAQAITGDFTDDLVDPEELVELEELDQHRFFYRRVGGFGK